MKIYELYDHQDVLKARITVDGDGHPDWDFTMDEWGGRWLSEDDRAEIVQACEYFEVHAPHDPGFRTKGFIIRRGHHLALGASSFDAFIRRRVAGEQRREFL
jgi:hypothetical protein